MKTSGLFTTHSFTIPVKSGKPVRIIFFGDVHRDAPGHALEKWHADLAYWRSLKDVYFFGMGDYLDSTSTTRLFQLIGDRLNQNRAGRMGNNLKNAFRQVIVFKFDGCHVVLKSTINYSKSIHG